jgi:hypothetical protein
VDHRADIYAVGVMAHQMLTSTLLRGAELLLSQLRAGLDSRLDGLLTKAIEQHRAQRHQGITDIRRTLERAKDEMLLRRSRDERSRHPAEAIST